MLNLHETHCAKTTSERGGDPKIGFEGDMGGGGLEPPNVPFKI